MSWSGVKSEMKGFLIFAYEFVCRLKTGAEQLIEILPDRRRASEKVTRQPFMHWIVKVSPDHSNTESNEIYFIQVMFKSGNQ